MGRDEQTLCTSPGLPMDIARSRVEDEDASDSPNLGGWGAGFPCTGCWLLAPPSAGPARNEARQRPRSPRGGAVIARPLRTGAREVADPSSRVREPHNDDDDDKGTR